MTGELSGLVVGVTGSRRANELAHLVGSHGGSPFVAPTVGIEASSDSSEVQKFLTALLDESARYAIFMTGPGVFALFSAARGMAAEKKIVDGLSGVTVIARSGKPKDALAKHGVRVDQVPDEATSEGILRLLDGVDLAGQLVIVLSHGSEASTLRSGLEERRARVVEVSTYSYSRETAPSGARVLDSMKFNAVMPAKSRVLELIDAAVQGEIGAITFTSPPSVRNLFAIAMEAGRLGELCSALSTRVIVVAVGPPTRAAIEEAGVTVDVMPSIYKMGPMVKGLCEYVQVHGREKRG